MNDDDIERRLADSARRWREDRTDPVPLEMALSRLPEFHQRQRGRYSVLLSLLAMVAVIAVAAIALIVLSAASGTRSDPGDRAPAPSTSVPAVNP